jgi:hypothetical protein
MRKPAIRLGFHATELANLRVVAIRIEPTSVRAKSGDLKCW